MTSILLLMIMLGGFCTSSIMGPMETLQENPLDLDSEEGVNPRPDLMELGRMIMTGMQSLLAHQGKIVESRLKQLELYVDHTCSNPGPAQTGRDPRGDLEEEVSQMMEGYMDYLSSMTQMFSDNLQKQFDAKMDEVMNKIEERLNNVPRSQEPKDAQTPSEASLNDNSSSEVDNSALSALSMKLDSYLKELVTRSDLRKQTENSNEQIIGLVHLISKLPHDQILNYTEDIHKVLYSFKPIYEDFSNAVQNCNIKQDHYNQMQRFEQLLQELKVEVDDNGSVLSNVFLAIEGASERIGKVINITGSDNSSSSNIQVTTVHPDTAPTSTEGSLTECRDSDFEGGKQSLDLCKAAVKYNKCSMRIVAYHCCRSCTDAGKLPEFGPHRYLAYPRKIIVFNKHD